MGEYLSVALCDGEMVKRLLRILSQSMVLLWCRVYCRDCSQFSWTFFSMAFFFHFIKVEKYFPYCFSIFMTYFHGGYMKMELHTWENKILSILMKWKEIPWKNSDIFWSAWRKLWTNLICREKGTSWKYFVHAATSVTSVLERRGGSKSDKTNLSRGGFQLSESHECGADKICAFWVLLDAKNAFILVWVLRHWHSYFIPGFYGVLWSVIWAIVYL